MVGEGGNVKAYQQRRAPNGGLHSCQAAKPQVKEVCVGCGAGVEMVWHGAQKSPTVWCDGTEASKNAPSHANARNFPAWPHNAARYVNAATQDRG